MAKKPTPKPAAPAAELPPEPPAPALEATPLAPPTEPEAAEPEAEPTPKPAAPAATEPAWKARIDADAAKRDARIYLRPDSYLGRRFPRKTVAPTRREIERRGHNVDRLIREGVAFPITADEYDALQNDPAAVPERIAAIIAAKKDT